MEHREVIIVNPPRSVDDYTSFLYLTMVFHVTIFPSSIHSLLLSHFFHTFFFVISLCRTRMSWRESDSVPFDRRRISFRKWPSLASAISPSSKARNFIWCLHRTAQLFLENCQFADCCQRFHHTVFFPGELHQGMWLRMNSFFYFNYSALETFGLAIS